MGTQGRDYYRQKHQIHHRGGRAGVNSGSGIKFLFYPLVVIGALWYGADVFLKHKANEKAVTVTQVLPKPLPPLPVEEPLSEPVPVPVPEPIRAVSRGTVLKADPHGQFRGTLLINNVPMPFLVDTGATTTSIPEKFAFSARVPFGRAVRSKTAGGTVVDRRTTIGSLRIGDTEIKNLDANINRYLEEVLIGMNTLKYFRMVQSGDTMTLTADNRALSDPNRVDDLPGPGYEAAASSQPAKKTVKIKKTVTCDARQVCRTSYSDR